MQIEQSGMLTRDLLLWMYDRMTLIRAFEQRVMELIGQGVPVGPVHLYIGQESVAVGVCAALDPKDLIASTHRGHGHCIAKGVDVRRMMAELFGKSTGTNKGKGGSMHITDFEVGVLGVQPIVGMGPTHAVGAGLSAKVRRTSQVVASFFGDGAASMGSVHEAMNLASIWSLPVLFICENNGYAQSTPAEYAIAVKDIVTRAPGYNMPGVVVDGQDVFAVWEACKHAVNRARAGKGPTLIECKTYRLCGHNQGDNPHRYRTKEEEDLAQERDCIKRFRKYVLQENLLDVKDLDAIEVENYLILDQAVSFAKASPLPEPEELYTQVYAD